MSECPCCGRQFESDQGMKIHKSQTHNRIEPWEDETTMRYLYLKKRLSAGDIADILPCNKGHVKRWLRRHDIERSISEGRKIYTLQEPPHHRWHNGYEQVVTKVGEDQKGVQIHRLVAIAKFGFEEVDGKVVHHKNGVKWDNRPENLEPLAPREHAQRHIEDRERGLEIAQR